MSSQNSTLDRRAALKARHRQAILDAADALIRERGRAQFSVDELAERADVARRTVFNHFASLDEIVITICTRVITDAVDEFRAATVTAPGIDASRASLFDEITAAVQGMDLPTVVAYLWGLLNDGSNPGRSQVSIQDVFTRTVEQLSIELSGRSSELDELEAEILVSSLMNGIAVVARHWILRTDGTLDASSRALWDELLERLIVSVRTGYSTPR